MGRARILFACAHSGLTRLEGWQGNETASVNLFRIARAASPVLYCVFSCVFPNLCPVVEFVGDIVVYKSWNRQQEGAPRLVNSFRGRGSAEERPEISDDVARTLGVSPTPPLLPDHAKTSDFWTFMRRPVLVSGLSCEDRGFRRLPAKIPTPPFRCPGDPRSGSNGCSRCVGMALRSGSNGCSRCAVVPSGLRGCY